MRDKDTKDAKLKKALRENLKKRKVQSRQVGDGEGMAVRLRLREIPKASPKENSVKDNSTINNDPKPDGDKE